MFWEAWLQALLINIVLLIGQFIRNRSWTIAPVKDLRAGRLGGDWIKFLSVCLVFWPSQRAVVVGVCLGMSGEVDFFPPCRVRFGICCFFRQHSRLRRNAAGLRQSCLKSLTEILDLIRVLRLIGQVVPLVFMVRDE